MEAEQRRVLETAFPGEEARYFFPMSIGSTPETADEGVELILNGTKALTSSPFWDYPDGKIPFVGALAVLLDGSRRPRGIVETTRVEIMPFGAITEEMACAYGEGGTDGRLVASGDGRILQSIGGTSRRGPHQRHPAHLGMVHRSPQPLKPNLLSGSREPQADRLHLDPKGAFGPGKAASCGNG